MGHMNIEPGFSCHYGTYVRLDYTNKGNLTSRTGPLMVPQDSQQLLSTVV